MKNSQKVKFVTGLAGLCLAFTGVAFANLSVHYVSAATTTATVSENDFWMRDGASVRAVKDSSGIRWITCVSKSWYDSLAIPENATVEFRTLVTSAENVTSIDQLTYDFSTELKDISCATKDDIAWKNGVFTYYGAILYGQLTDTQKVTAFATELISRSYIKVTNGEDVSIYYADADDTARSIRAVAKEVVEDTAEFSKLDEDAQTAVKKYFGQEADATVSIGEVVYEGDEAIEIGQTDYTVAYLDAKKVGKVDGTAIKLTNMAPFTFGETYTLTLFDASNNYAHTTPFKYVVSDLQAPTNVTYTIANKTLTWDAVDNASGYVVKVNGVEYTTNTNSYVLDETALVVQVKAKGSWACKDSVYSSVYQVNVPDGYLVAYGADGFEDTIVKENYGGWYWNPKTMEVSYATDVAGAENGDALKVTQTFNGNGCAAFRITIPKTLSGGEVGTKYVIRLKHNGKLNQMGFNANSTLGSWKNAEADTNGWIEFEITKDSFTQIDLLFKGKANETVDIYLDYIKVVES